MLFKRSFILAVTLVLFSLTALTACTSATAQTNMNQETAEEIYNKVWKNVSAQTFLDSTTVMDMILTADGETMETRLRMDVKAENVDTPEMIMHLYLDLDINGQNMVTETYYMDNYYYVTVLGQNMKYEMPYAEMLAQIEASRLDELDFSLFSKVDLYQDGDVSTISYEMDTSLLSDDMNQYLSLIESAGFSQDMVSNIRIEETTGEITLNKDYQAISADFHIIYEMEVYEETIRYDMNISTVYHQTEGVSIQLPNADDYIAIDTSLLQ